MNGPPPNRRLTAAPSPSPDSSPVEPGTTVPGDFDDLVDASERDLGDDVGRGEVAAPQTDDSANSVLVTEPIPTPPRPRLVTTPGTAADRRGDVARWVVTLTEPLVDTAQRAKRDQDMARFIDHNSGWASAYLAGLLTEIAHTLPPDDPWLHLGSLIDLDQVATGRPTTNPDKRLARRSLRAPLPATTGSLDATARPFGTSQDAADILMPEMPEASTDVGITALAENLSPLASALVGFAAHDAKTLQYVLNQVFHHLWLAHFSGLMSQTAGEAMLATAGSALRWLVHRRRSYTGDDDPYPVVVGFSWLSRADRVEAGASILVEAVMAEQGKIDPAAYRIMTGTEDQGADGFSHDSGDDF